ncbi:MAG TPA: DUF4190 domain-containing protein [Tepidisphaeraceae bacterium]|jgi:hypothetical protein|nr:DUF4190 domain-containing protein [Tepidisphaeraceae bacterium]
MTQLESDPNRDAKSPGDRQYDAEDDALAHLHKMSGTGSAFGAAEYVAINPVAIAALILGVASALTLALRTASVLIAIPLAGIICAFVAMVQVRRSNGTQSGRGFALIGLALCVLLGAAVVGLQGLAYAATRGDNRKCAALIEEFGGLVRAQHYDQAYDMMSQNFHERVNLQKFIAGLEQFQSVPGYGTVESMRWNGESMHFDVVGDSNRKIGYALALVKFRKVAEPTRESFEFTDREGDWKIDNLTNVFARPKRKKSATPSVE